MKPLDYAQLGLRCGLEIHQQLDTTKLFCSCPSGVCDDHPDFTFQRKLRASAGETGEVDVAARHEADKDATFLYEGCYTHSCLVEMDEEPPHAMNPEALKTVLQVCAMLSTKPVDQVQVMRKTVIDGSNTSGFQRTALVGRDGTVSVHGKTIRIPTVCIEEDAARIIQREKDFTLYRLDRLGIPLIEIATHADITSPEECKAVAEHLGMLLRSTGKVKRGLGTIRQDVNVSLREGARVEIKGAQDLKQIKKLVVYEALRQNNLLSLKETLHKPKHLPAPKELTNIFSTTNCVVLANKTVMGVVFEGLAGYLGKEIQPHKRLGTELSDYAKTAGVKGLFHSDENLDDYGISKPEQQRVKEALDVKEKDAFVLIGAKKAIAERALAKVVERVSLLYEGVPEEVRKANEDASSTFLRPMPGGSRMYPETDIPPLVPDLSQIELPELLTEKKQRIKQQYNLSDDLAGLLVKHNIDLATYIKAYPHIDPVFLAEYFVNMGKEIKRRFGLEVDMHIHAPEVLRKVNDGTVPKDAVLELVVDLAKGKTINWDAFGMTDEDLEKTLHDVINKNPYLDVKALMGEAMKVVRGKVPGKKVLEILKRLKEA